MYERQGPKAYSDATAINGNYVGVEITTNSYPGLEILPLKNQRHVIEGHFTTAVTSGTTAEHVGMSLGYNLISPRWGPVRRSENEPAAYDDSDVKKVVIIMTDGFNTWVSNRESANDQQAEICDDMKNNNIIVFSVTFQTDIAVAPLLQRCASADGGYYDVTDGRALAAAYHEDF